MTRPTGQPRRRPTPKPIPMIREGVLDREKCLAACRLVLGLPERATRVDADGRLCLVGPDEAAPEIREEAA